MRADLFHYDLPEDQIAKYPLSERDGARLLVLDVGEIAHQRVRDWPDLLEPGSLVVLNETRVMRARLLGIKHSSGGKAELLLLEREPDSDAWLALGKASKSFKPGQMLTVGEGTIEVLAVREHGHLVVRAVGTPGMEEIMTTVGQVPIPPYLKRESDVVDQERYQTVFAKSPGSVAAPTAGLHLTEEVLSRLRARDVAIGRLILHVGVGTFRPVSAEKLEDHVMHAEHVEVSATLAEQVQAARARGKKVVAVGTTVVRALETAAVKDGKGLVHPYAGPTQLFITPGYRFEVVDALFTNFHQPQSTLLMLVSAFAGQAETLAAYQAAVLAGYRFLSYGDAMWIPTRARPPAC